MYRENTRSAGIDLARSIAIISVLLLHSGVFYPGRYGVQLFFIISGYLLADMSSISNQSFLIKRIFRLFPLYWVILVFFYSDYFNSLGQLFVSILLLQNIHWNLQAIPGSWSISNEWIFSVTLILLRNLKKKILLGLILISWVSNILSFVAIKYFLNTPSHLPNEGYVFNAYIYILNPLINLSFFLIGVGIKRELLPILKSKFSAIAIIAIGTATSNFIGLDSMFIWLPILWAIFSMSLNWSPDSRNIQQIIQFIGKRTYGIFFIHFIVLEHVTNFKFINKMPETYFIQNIGIFSMTLLISLGFSEASWRLLEVPSMKIAAQLIKFSPKKKTKK